MDTGKRYFKEIKNDQLKIHQTIDNITNGAIPITKHYFRVGEELEIRGSLFRVKSIKPPELRLKLLRRRLPL